MDKDIPVESPEVPVFTQDHFDKFTSYPHPIKVKTKIHGIRHTQPSVIASQVSRLEQCTTVMQFLEEHSKVSKRWDKMDIFKSNNYFLEPLGSQNEKGFIVNLVFKEKDERRAGVSVMRQNNFTAPEVHFSGNNVFGRAWEVSVMAQGTIEAYRQAMLTLRAKSPSFGEVHQWALSVFTRRNNWHSLRTERCNSISFGVEQGVHLAEVGYETRNNQPLNITDVVSPALKQDQGESEKIFLRHQCTLSHVTESPDFPFPEGTNLWVSNEVAAGVNNVKHDVKLDWYQKLLHTKWLSSCLSLHLKTGIVWPFGQPADMRRVRVNDRYFLNDSFVRGYKIISPGVEDVTSASPAAKASDSATASVLPPPPPPLPATEITGGNVLAAGSASVNFHFPALVNACSGHVFINSGNVQYTEKPEEIFTQSYATQFLNGCKTSVGAGLLFRLVPLTYGRVELNFALPLVDSQCSTRCPLVLRPNTSVFSKFMFGLHWTNV